MRTDDLIRALASDRQEEATGVPAAAARAVPAAVFVVAAIVVAGIGLRPGLATPQLLPVVATKLAVTLALAATALFLALRLARSTEFGLNMPAILFAAPLLLAIFVIGDLAQAGVAGWSGRMLGNNGWFCLTMVPLLSLPPLAALFHALRAGAVTRPALAGFVAGLAAAGVGASFYALHCTDDSPLFVAFWYGIAAFIVAGVGALAGRLLLRW